MEKASRRGGTLKTPIEQIPAFRQHLARTGKTLTQVLAAQPAPDLDAESLNLQKRKNSLTKRK